MYLQALREMAIIHYLCIQRYGNSRRRFLRTARMQVSLFIKTSLSKGFAVDDLQGCLPTSVTLSCICDSVSSKAHSSVPVNM